VDTSVSAQASVSSSTLQWVRKAYDGLSEEDSQQLKSIFAEPKSFDEQWFETCNEFIAFHQEHGMLPSGRAEPGSAERVLNSWLQTQRAKQATMPNERLEYIDKHCPEILQSSRKTWDVRLRELRQFQDRHGRFPNRAGDNATERALGGWVIKWRAKRESLTDEQVQLTLRLLPGFWEESPERTQQQLWDQRLHQVAQHVAKNNRLPSQKSTDATERILGRWVSYWRGRRALLTSKQVTAIDRRVPTFWPEHESHSPKLAWEAKLALVADFISKNSRLPMASREDEKTLGRWVSKCRELSAKHSPERLALIEEGCPALLAGSAWEHANRPGDIASAG
jgi:hypothetical protein